jgi:hypothetical protein
MYEIYHSALLSAQVLFTMRANRFSARRRGYECFFPTWCCRLRYDFMKVSEEELFAKGAKKFTYKNVLGATYMASALNGYSSLLHSYPETDRR